jgi:hypothetical protein
LKKNCEELEIIPSKFGGKKSACGEGHLLSLHVLGVG